MHLGWLLDSTTHTPTAATPPAPTPTAVMTYCTNSHAGETLDQVQRALHDVFVQVRDRLGIADDPLGVGLWLPATTIREVTANHHLPEFREFLRDHRFVAPSMNAFPFGSFHGPIVKEAVYRPAWWERARLDYTIACATVLALLLDDRPDSWRRVPAAISTVGGGAYADLTPERETLMRLHLGLMARELADIHARTGHEIVLGLEPEPLTALQFTPDVLGFFARLFADASAIAAAGGETTLRQHIGVCFDACHQAVLWEDVPHSYRQIRAAGIRIAKVQLSCAVECPQEPAARRALRDYVEPRYLHQVYAPSLEPGGSAEGKRDLHEALDDPTWRPESPWRCHFHVPIFLAELGYGLRSTQPDLIAVIEAIRDAAAVDGAVPLLEVETYTWAVLPEGLEPERTPEHPGGPAGLAAELDFVRQLWTAPRR